MSSGDTPPPFGGNIIFTKHILDMLRGRFRLVWFGIIMIGLYLTAAFLANEIGLSDIIFLLGGIFLVYRSIKLSDEIQEIEQYLHGEGVPALE